MNENNKRIHLLALETSGLTSGVYFSVEDKLIGQITLHQRNIHSRKLAESVTQLLRLWMWKKPIFPRLFYLLVPVRLRVCELATVSERVWHTR